MKYLELRRKNNLKRKPRRLEVIPIRYKTKTMTEMKSKPSLQNPKQKKRMIVIQETKI